MLKYHFYKKKVWPGQPEYKLIAVEPPFDVLSDLSNGVLSKPEGVQEVIREISAVQNGEKEEYCFGPSDFCFLGVSGKVTTVTSSVESDENVFEISTTELKSLLEDWAEYLKADQ